jgi:serine/threonine-protein kinase
VDKRADIWSFGVVLWEMLTGRRLFGGGESTSHVLADVLRAPIDFENVPDGSLRELLRRCLDRNVRTRLRDIGEVRVALSGPIESTTTQDATPRHTTSLLPWAVAALLAMSTGVALWAPWRGEPARPLRRVNVDLGADVRLQPVGSTGSRVEISPDGTRLAYVALRDKLPRLYLQRLDALDDEPATELPGTEGAIVADFSPDSRSLVFVAGRRVSRVSVDGGVPLHLADTDLPHSHVTWGHGDMIVVSGIRGLRQIPSDKGAPVTLTEPEGDDESFHSHAHVLPGANTVLFSVVGLARGTPAIKAVSLADGQRKDILSGAMTPYYLPSGHLLFLRQGTLFAIRFDLDRVETEGDAVPLVTDVRTYAFGLVRPGSFSVSDTGTLVYRKRSNDPGVTETPGSSTLHIIERTGTRSPLAAPAVAYRDLRFSPDSSQLALTVLGVPPSIAILNIETGVMRSLGVAGFEPAWRPPLGQHLVFTDAVRSGLHSVPTNGGSRSLCFRTSVRCQGSPSIRKGHDWRIHGAMRRTGARSSLST